MHPVLISLGPITLHTYGFFLALGFLAGMFVIVREAKRVGMDPERILDLSFYALLTAIIASRVPFVLFNWSLFENDFWAIFRLWEGGLVFYGGFLGAAAVFIIYVKKYSLPFWKLTDVVAVGVPLGHAFGRIGCFFAGCCYGEQCDLPWAVTFTNPQGLAPQGIPLHPTQLYSALGNLCIFFVLYFLVRKRKTFDGQVFCLYLLLYAIFRFCVEFLRGDDRGAFLFNLFSPSQSLALAIAALALVFLFVLPKRQKS